MRIAIVLIFICFLAVVSFSQTTAVVEGIIKVKGKVVSNKTVRLVSKTDSYESITDNDGNYRFSGISDGSYLLVYGNSSARVNVDNGTVRVSPLAEVVVVPTGTSQPLSEVSKTINTIEPREMRERADFALVESLRTIPGFRVQQLGGFGRTASIKTRGLRNQDTAILLDGMRLRDPAAITGDASPFLSDITLTSVKRVEILRGSGSSVYGTNAIGGVLDFHTPSARKDFHGQLSGAFGGLGLKRVRGNTSYGTNDNKFGANLAVSRTVYSEGIDGEDDAHNTNFQSRIEFNPLSTTNISGRFFVSDAYVRLNSNPDTAGTLPGLSSVIDAKEGTTFLADVNDPDNTQKSKFFSGQVELTQIINPNLIFKGSYQGLKTSRENENGSRGVGFQPFGGNETSIFDGQIHTLKAKLDWNTSSNNFVSMGYEYEREIYGNKGITPSLAGNFFANARQSSNTFFVQDLLALFENRLQLAAGFRAQWFLIDSPTFSVNNAPYNNLNIGNPPTSYTFDGSGSYYFPSTQTKIRAHIGNGYRVPSLYERLGTFYSSFSQTFTALGDPRLEPERSIAFDVGIDQALYDDRVKFSATYFYTSLTDTIGYGFGVPAVGTTARPFGGYLNQRGGISRGAEFSGDIKASDSTEIFASYTFTNSDQRSPQVAGSEIVRTLGVADHQFTVVATQRFGRLALNFDFVANTSYLAPIFSNSIFSTRIYRFDGMRRGDITARYEMFAFDEKTKFVFFGTIENVFADEYFENGFRTIGRTGRIGFGVSF